MTGKKIPKKFIPSLLLATACLTGCTPFVKYPHPSYVSKRTAGATAGGAATGAILGSAASGTASAGLGIGALAGAAIGTYIQSPAHWLKKLQNDGILVVQTGQIVKIVIPTDKIFVLGTDSIEPTSYAALDDVTHFIQNYGRVNLTISGYTDSVGDPLNNYHLSADQAKTVMAFFWSHGIPNANMKAEGHGDSNPIAANYTVLGSTYNRRIEVTFAYG